MFDIASRTSGDPSGLPRGAMWLIGIGVVGALLAAVFGLLDLSIIPRGTKAFATGITHMTLNLVVVGLFVVNFFLRSGTDHDEAAGTVPFALTIVGLVLLGVSGWLGGRLAYHFGVRVADERTQAEGFASRDGR